MKHLKLLLVVFFVHFISAVKADEGMWLPIFLQQLNEKEMKAMGMKISAKDIYDINKGSLKDAIVIFGGGCTGEVVSSKGLLFTNHHCGFDAIQNNSTLEHNYLQNGFWAKSTSEELPNPGLAVTFIVRIEDVSKQVLNGVTADMSEPQRQSAVDKNIAELKKTTKKESYQDVLVRPFYDGNQYFLFITEVYKDVRLVGAPPSSIGNFGKDSDNWMWPRHNADFSMFRIYADKNNHPAEYSTENVPYKPKKSLSISLDGVAENDFTMVFGFPGRTTQYLHSAAVDQIVNVLDPARINIRTKALSVIDGFMRKDEKIKLQYASKYAGIANSWKKWQGEVMGLTATNAVAKKKAYEAEFQKRVDANPQFKAKYGTLLADLGAAYKEIENYARARDYYNETISRIEAFTINALLNNLRAEQSEKGEEGLKAALPKIKDRLAAIYNEYNAEVDRQLFIQLIKNFKENQTVQFLSPYLTDKLKEFNNNYEAFADDLYKDVDLFQNGAKVIANLEKTPEVVMAANEMGHANQLYVELNNHFFKTASKQLSSAQSKINRLNRTYMQAQMEVMKDRRFYPDANSTLRITYGKVAGYQPRDGVQYDYFTYLDGVMEKYKPGDYEFDVPEKLQELYKNKDFGPYAAKNGKMPVCFIGRNHTTGGNSGSPALDAYGNLLGLNFDRVWEGTMSDINYDPSICRNIMVDIRYVLFIIDKYAGAGHLLKEMKLVHPKKTGAK